MAKRYMAPIVAIALGCTGFVRHGDSGNAPGSHDAADSPVERLNRVANDATRSQADRAAVIFELFKNHIKPGDDLHRVGAVLRNPGWIDEARLYHFLILAGYIPIAISGEHRTYSLHLFADGNGHSPWVIYLQLAGKSVEGMSHDDGVAFLRGQPGSCGKTRLLEFALYYPDGSTEVFRAGKALEVGPGAAIEGKP